jgi:excisionase family DNA binding protein
VTAARLLSPDQVADLIGVSTSTLAKWRQAGEPDLPYIRVAGRIRYRSSDVEAFIEDEDDGDDDSDDDEFDDEDEENDGDD